MVIKRKDNHNKPHHSEHLSTWFSQSVQHRRKCIMNTELRHLHFQRYNNANTAINLQTRNVTVLRPNCGGLIIFQIKIYRAS